MQKGFTQPANSIEPKYGSNIPLTDFFSNALDRVIN